jgi:hypothetical protein
MTTGNSASRFYFNGVRSWPSQVHIMFTKRMIPLLLVVACVSGCDDLPQMKRRGAAPAGQTYTKEELLRAVEDAQREAAATKPPPPVISLPELDGWVRSEPRSLPPEDHGFTVAYDHRSGLAVTLYRFTRGLRVIPDDLQSGPTQDEMQRAKAGIEQGVQLGYWQAAKETDNGVAPLGDSAKQALWSRFIITVNGNAVTSDTYVWSHSNAFLKIRCTGQSLNSEAEAKVLSELLTALGNACSSNEK